MLHLLLSVVMSALPGRRTRAHGRPARVASRPLCVVLGAICAATGTLVSVSGSAGAVTDTQRRIAELQELIGEVSSQEAALLQEIVDSTRRRGDLDAQIAGLEELVGDANAQLAAASAKAEQVQLRYLDLETRVRAQEAQLDAARDSFNAAVVALYKGGESSLQLYVSMALEADGPHEVFAASKYVTATAADRRGTLRKLGKLRNATKALQADLDVERVAANEAQLDAADERARLDGLRRRQASARAAALREEANERVLLAKLRSRKADFEAELNALQRESDSIGAMLRGRQAGQRPPASIEGILRAPVSARVTSPFGYRVHPILGTRRLHAGIDYGAAAGTPIVAADGGVVVWAGPRGGYGNAVIIDHGNTLATLYAHQSRVAVGVGATVRPGQTIGFVGSTGFSTGPHLHFEVRKLGTPVNPTSYL